MHKFLIGVLALLLNSQAFAIDPKINTYNVSGANAVELRQSLTDNGPNPAEMVWGKTTNSWDYTFTRVQEDGKYKIGTINVVWSAIIEMPNWPGYKSASECRKKNWDAMYNTLMAHELKHIELGKGVKEKIEAAALKINPQDSENALDGALDATSGLIKDENQKVQDGIDPFRVELKSC